MIYYVEDDNNIRDLVVYTLESTGLPAKGFPERTAERLSERASERGAESAAERKSERVPGRVLSPDEFLSVGAITMDSLRHIVTAGGEEVPLTLKEYEFLRKLMLNPEIVLSRDQILADVWGYEFDGETRTVDVHVRTLRQKLGAAGSQIETIRGGGYRIRSRE
nr:winged helix-turn-helix domain-containing protein [Lachnoclostridium sp. Marseille-P6806]